MSGTEIALGLLVVVAAMAVALYLVERRRRLVARELWELRAAEDALQQQTRIGAFGPIPSGINGGDGVPPPLIPDMSGESSYVPEVPPGLVDAFAQRSCVLFAGGGVAAQAGLPTWRDVLRRLCIELEGADPDRWSSVRPLVETDPEAAADLIDARLERPELVALVERVMRTSHVPLSGLHRTLSAVPFSGVITNTWDTLVDQAFEAREPTRLEPEAEDFGSVLRNEQFFLLKTFGDIGHGLRFTTEEYRRTVVQNPMYARFLASIFATRTILFLGVGAQSIEEFLKSSELRFSPDRAHYALVPDEEVSELERERLAARYNLQVLTFRPSPGFPEVATFARSLRERVGEQAAPTGARRPIKALVLQQVRLTNIGPFHDLTLSLEPRWNVLLGDNGCGKSTILRATALALCGDDDRAVPSAARLLRSGASSGSIELRIGDDTYRTELVRDGQRVRVLPRQITPLQSGGCLVLGVPALRGSSSTRISGPSQRTAPEPGVEDVLPILTGTIDRRLDSLKQWVINTESFRDEGGRNDQLMETFFKLINQVTPGPTVSFSRIDRDSWEVMMHTDDGEVPLDFISQGMSSVLSWVGALLQRLYEVHSDDPQPENRAALVLVDEIDAHLHPEWQRHLIPILRDNFPELQIVATSHSPLIAGSVGVGQLTRLYRIPGEKGISCERVRQSLVGWSADEILTSVAFDLETTRDLDTEAALMRYIALVTKDDLAPNQEAEVAQLAAKLKVRTPAPKERRAARMAFETIEEAVNARLKDLSMEERTKVVQEIRLQLIEAEGGSSASK